MHEEGASSVRTILQGLALAMLTALGAIVWQMHTDVVLLSAQMTYMSTEISALQSRVAAR